MKKAFLFLILCYSEMILAAACCGGGSSNTAVITNDDKAQFSTTLSQSQVQIDVDSQGVWSHRQTKETTKTLQLEGAMIFKDRFQAGLSVPVIERTRETQSSRGLGDSTLQMGYEYLTNWDYHPWKPRAVGYLTVVVPTGRNINEATQEGLDARGKGFWSLGVGTIFTKIHRAWDFSAQFDIHKSFEKKIQRGDESLQLTPGQGGQASLGAGYNFARWRWGFALSWIYEDPLITEGLTKDTSSAERYTTATASVAYMFKDEWGGVLSYSDQALFGDPLSTTLSKSVSLRMSYHWFR